MPTLIPLASLEKRTRLIVRIEPVKICDALPWAESLAIRSHLSRHLITIAPLLSLRIGVV